MRSPPSKSFTAASPFESLKRLVLPIHQNATQTQTHSPLHNPIKQKHQSTHEYPFNPARHRRHARNDLLHFPLPVHPTPSHQNNNQAIANPNKVNPNPTITTFKPGSQKSLYRPRRPPHLFAPLRPIPTLHLYTRSFHDTPPRPTRQNAPLRLLAVRHSFPSPRKRRAADAERRAAQTTFQRLGKLVLACE